MRSPTEARTLRVALLNPCYWPEVRRGSERVLRELADGLIAHGHKPRLITSHPGLPSRRLEDGLPVTRHWRPPSGRLRRRRFEDYLTHVPFSYLSLRAGDDDVAQALYGPDALAAARWSRRTGRPSIFSHMGIVNHPALVGWRLRVEIMLRAARECSATVALTDRAGDAFERWLGIRPRVIHPGVDLDAFRPGAGRSDVPTIFCPAALDEPRKRVDLLIRALPLVRRERPRARLVLSHRPGMPLVTEDGVEQRDVDDHAALVRAYREAWLCALPSVAEAFGLVLVEALACGTPVVGSDEGGIPEVIDRDSIGRLFDGDERDLARKLLETLELAEDPATAPACRERAEDFPIERMVERYEALYRELLEARF